MGKNQMGLQEICGAWQLSSQGQEVKLRFLYCSSETVSSCPYVSNQAKPTNITGKSGDFLDRVMGGDMRTGGKALYTLT